MFWHFVDRSLRDHFRGVQFLQSRDHLEVSDGARLEAACCWLERSIAACDGQASSKGYRFMRGWMPAYPETTGYIIPTLLLLDAGRDHTTGYRDTAIQLGQWLLEQQLPNGGFVGGEVGRLTEPDVFDTGMIMLGFNALAHEFGIEPFRAAIERACHFLMSSMDTSGNFVRHVSNGLFHAYNVRAAWGLMAAGHIVGEKLFIDAAERNARWTLAQQNDAGFFANNTFKINGNANTHGTAYVLRGLLEIHELTGDLAYLTAVLKAARALQLRYHQTGWIAADLAHDWDFLSSHICLTGYAQLAIIYYRLYQKTGDASFRKTADTLLGDVFHTQSLTDPANAHYGAIAGSFPIYGRYAPLQYPNWATKFFIDALLTKRQVDRNCPRLPFQRFSG